MERGGLPWIYSVCGKGNIIDECKTCPIVPLSHVCSMGQWDNG